MTHRFKALRAVFATAILAASAAGVATAAGSPSCDPMYPCAADAGTPAAVYDLAIRTGGAPCESYPCYPENVQPASSPMAADTDVTIRSADQHG